MATEWSEEDDQDQGRLFDDSQNVEISSGGEFDSAMQEFLDPIHGFVKYTEREIEIIDHPAFQRLFGIYQLGQTHLVFRGATHKRGEHALGSIHTVELLIQAIRETSSSNKIGNAAKRSEIGTLGPPISEAERTFARLAALLHDIGHIAVGHTLEDEVGLLDRHESRRRLNMVLNWSEWGDIAFQGTNGDSDAEREALEFLNSRWSETLFHRIARLYDPVAIRAALIGEKKSDDTTRGSADHRLNAVDILLEIIGIAEESEFSNIRQAEGIEAKDAFRISVLRDLIGNTVCADLIDYLERDWRHIGKPKFLDTRLLQYMEIRTDGATPHLTINLTSDRGQHIRSDVMTAILELLENRHHLWEIALLHRTKTSASAMLERAIQEKAFQGRLLELITYHVFDTGLSTEKNRNKTRGPLDEEVERIAERLAEVLFLASDVDIHRVLADTELTDGDKVENQDDNGKDQEDAPDGSELPIQEADEPLRPVISTGNLIGTGSEETHQALLNRLSQRILHKEVARVQLGVNPDKISKLLAPHKASQLEKLAASCRRWDSMKKLEVDFNIPKGSLVMYCVPKGLGRKLAEVRVLHDGHVRKLHELDDDPSMGESVSGGHLSAQLNRADQLWRASLFASAEALAILERRNLIGTLVTAFERVVLEKETNASMYDLLGLIILNDPDPERRQRRLHAYHSFDKEDQRFMSRAEAARGAFSQSHYVTGEPTLRHLLDGLE